MSHYYTPDVQLPHEPGSVSLTISERTLIFATDAGVFGRREVDYGSRLLSGRCWRRPCPLRPHTRPGLRIRPHRPDAGCAAARRRGCAG